MMSPGAAGDPGQHTATPGTEGDGSAVIVVGQGRSSVEPTLAPPRRGASAWIALALATFSMVVGFAVWSLLAPLAPLFRQEWGLSATEVGVLVAVPVILGSLARIPLGIIT